MKHDEIAICYVKRVNQLSFKTKFPKRGPTYWHGMIWSGLCGHAYDANGNIM